MSENNNKIKKQMYLCGLFCMNTTKISKQTMLFFFNLLIYIFCKKDA